jgi:hypothetical protein
LKGKQCKEEEEEEEAERNSPGYMSSVYTLASVPFVFPLF